MKRIVLEINKELANKWESLPFDERENITHEIELLLKDLLYSSREGTQVVDEPAVSYHVAHHNQINKNRQFKNGISLNFINNLLRISEQNLRNRNESEEHLQQNRQFFEQWKSELMSHPLNTEEDKRELLEMMKKASAIAEANGLTDDILEQLLAEDNE